MIGIPGIRTLLAPFLCLGALALAAAGCGGATPGTEASPAGPLGSGLALLPNDPALHRHVLVADLARLRRAYPERASLQQALVGVWLPDALVGAKRILWRDTFGLRLDEVTSFVSAGFHPSEVTVALGHFAPSAVRSALRRSGYRAEGILLASGADGSIDVTSDAGRLALSSLNRVAVGPDRVVAASTSALARAANVPSASLAENPGFAALAAALDPITSAIVLDADLVRPPFGVPVRTLPRHSARLVGVGIDDAGAERRTLKIVLVYGDPSQASEDAPLIERALGSTELPGDPSTRFSDFASGWQVMEAGQAVLLTARLPPERDSGDWRLLLERGDLAPLVRPEG